MLQPLLNQRGTAVLKVAICLAQLVAVVSVEQLDARMDIVFVYLASGTSLPVDHYVRSSLQAAKTNNPNAVVTLITDSMVPSPPIGIQIVNASDLVTQRSRRFEQLYRKHIKPHWIEREQVEWSLGHMLRYFYLHEYMSQKSVTAAFYFECDVLVVRDLRQLNLECESYLWAPRDQSNVWATGRWTSWAGVSYFKSSVLDKFIDFSSKLVVMDSPLLEQKGTINGHLTDMSWWYLFIAASSADFQRVWQIPDDKHQLWPASHEVSICNMGDIGMFDERDGDLKPWFKGWRVPGLSTNGLEYTIHFCAARKHVLTSLVQSGRYPEEPKLIQAMLWTLSLLMVCMVSSLFYTYTRHIYTRQKQLSTQVKRGILAAWLVLIGLAYGSLLFVQKHGLTRSWLAKKLVDPTRSYT